MKDRASLGAFTDGIEGSGEQEGTEVAQKTDLVDEAVMAMGGFGRLQKISWIMCTLT